MAQRLAWSVAAGVVVAAVYTLTPLTESAFYVARQEYIEQLSKLESVRSHLWAITAEIQRQLDERGRP